MDEKTMDLIAEKIKNKTATEEEILAFIKEYNNLLEKVNNELSQ
ncbi:MAG: hypothetical protein WCW65_01120 [Candidatus Paceibacterota bacterium]